MVDVLTELTSTEPRILTGIATRLQLGWPKKFSPNGIRTQNTSLVGTVPSRYIGA
jgi:hypothetical protein